MDCSTDSESLQKKRQREMATAKLWENRAKSILPELPKVFDVAGLAGKHSAMNGEYVQGSNDGDYMLVYQHRTQLDYSISLEVGESENDGGDEQFRWAWKAKDKVVVNSQYKPFGKGECLDLARKSGEDTWGEYMDALGFDADDDFATVQIAAHVDTEKEEEEEAANDENRKAAPKKSPEDTAKKSPDETEVFHCSQHNTAALF